MSLLSTTYQTLSTILLPRLSPCVDELSGAADVRLDVKGQFTELGLCTRRKLVRSGADTKTSRTRHNTGLHGMSC
jgi:hypothetical protein